MNAIEWLGRWEDIPAPGKHSKLYPALFACGYQYHGRRSEQEPTMWDRVNRAIPVDGTVGDARPTWNRSPQVLFWMEPEKASLWERIKAWLRRGCAE